MKSVLKMVVAVVFSAGSLICSQVSQAQGLWQPSGYTAVEQSVSGNYVYEDTPDPPGMSAIATFSGGGSSFCEVWYYKTYTKIGNPSNINIAAEGTSYGYVSSSGCSAYDYHSVSWGGGGPVSHFDNTPFIDSFNFTPTTLSATTTVIYQLVAAATNVAGQTAYSTPTGKITP